MKHAKRNKFLSLILTFIAFDVLCDNYIASSFNNESPVIEFSLLVGVMLLQIVFSPIQAGFSDFYGRKISLVVSISFSILSLIFVYLYDLHTLTYLPIIIAICVSKGILGNTVPISWAAIGDLGKTEGKNLRFFFALATASYAVAYLILIFMKKTFSDIDSTLLIIILFILVLFICVRHFFDMKDPRLKNIIKSKNTHLFDFIKKELILIKNDTKNKLNQMILLSWIFWEISIYIILAYFADFGSYESTFIAVSMMIGYLIGTISMKFLSHVPDSKMIRVGYIISIISLIPYFFLYSSYGNQNSIISTCYFFHAIGNAILSPTLFSIISKNKKEHERGKIYGLVESADTIAFLMSGVAIITLKYFKLDLFILVCVSFFTVIVAWAPYKEYERITEKS